MSAFVAFETSEITAAENDKTDEELSVWLIVSRGPEMLLYPTLFNVTNLDPKDYGIDLNMIESINGAQLFIQAHAEIFGEENVTSAMNMRQDGWLYKFWNVDDMLDGYYISYTVNGRMYNVCANSISMEEDSIVNVKFYMFGGEEALRSFRFLTQNVLVGDKATLDLSGAPDPNPDFTIAGASVWLWNEEGEDIELGKADKNGKFSYLFGEPGTYWVYSQGAKTAIGWAQVIVRDVYVDGISINKSKAELYVNEKIDLDVTVTPHNADETGVQWSSSNKKVASVSADGIVKGLSPGRTIITVKTLDGDFVTSCEVTVEYDNSLKGGGSDNNGEIIFYVGIGAIGIIALAVVVLFYIKR